MDAFLVLVRFFKTIETDYRVRNIHIAVFTALLVRHAGDGFTNPLMVYSCEMLEVLKITKASTYCKCLSELNEYGYVKYEPSFKKNLRSKIYFPDVSA